MSDTKKSQSELIAASLRLADQTLRRVIDAIEPYLKQADERGPSGQLTKAAKDARQRLKNPELNITVPSVSLQKAIPNALMKAAEEVNSKEAAVAKAIADLEVAYSAEEFQKKRAELYESAAGESPPRRRQTDPQRVEPEEMTFLLEMRELGVPTSVMDQGSFFERCHIAALLKELAHPIAERSKAGPWARAFAGGQLNVSGTHMTPGEAEAIRRLVGRHDEAAEAAKRIIQEKYGETFDVSPGFALILLKVALDGGAEEYDSLSKNADRAADRVSRGDVDLILSALGNGANAQEVRNQLREAALLAESKSYTDLSRHQRFEHHELEPSTMTNDGDGSEATDLHTESPPPVGEEYDWAADGLGLPGWVTAEAAASFDALARQMMEYPDWPLDVGLYWRGWTDTSRSGDDIRTRIEGLSVATTVAREYLKRLNAFGLAAADDFLVEWGTRWFTKDIATSEVYKKDRLKWGFPQPGDH